VTITVTQTNSLDRVLPHPVTNPVVKPVLVGGFLEEEPLTTTIHDLLMRVEKNGRVFWVGAAVPFGTLDFTRAQVAFHPTVIQNGHVHAADADYPAFANGWRNHMQHHVAVLGGQLAGARRMPLLMPFTTMAALGDPAQNVFGSAPVDTLNALLTAVRNAFSPIPLGPVRATAVGVSSFSSGIDAMRLFIHAFASSGLLREVIDFDSPFLLSEKRKTLTHAPGAVSSCYSQVPADTSPPPAGYRFLPAPSFAHITSQPSPHMVIGRMMYYTAMITSQIT